MDKVYSVWLKPYGKAEAELKSLIAELAKNHGSVVFEPHLTLAWPLTGSEADVVAKTQLLASYLVPIHVDLVKADYGTDFFRCIFLHAEKTELLIGSMKKAKEIFAKKPANHQATLTAVYGEKKAKEIFAREAETTFMPHVSVMYGGLLQNIKIGILQNLDFRPINFTANSIFLYETPDNFRQWKLVKEFPIA